MAPATKKRRTGEDTSVPASPADDDEIDSKAASSKPAPPQKTAAPSASTTSQQHAHRDAAAAMAAASENEHKSNVFRMQTDEMLAEVRLGYQKRRSPMERILRKVKSAIYGLREREGLSLAQVEDLMKSKRIAIPFPDPRPAKDIKYTFSYVRPEYMNVVGGYSLQTAIRERERTVVDLALMLPSSIFQEKDYLNYRYFHKRAVYLACVASAIRESEDLKGLKLSFDYANGDPLRPVLLMQPAVENPDADLVAAKCDIRLMLAVAPDVFPLGKLLPSKNCVRPAQSSDAAAPQSYPSTPSYNASLVADTALFEYASFLHSSTETCPAFEDACILGRIWLRQRGFSGAVSKGGFGHFEWAVTMALLLQGGGVRGHALLSPGYSNYQMFKATLQFLATRDLMAEPLWLNSEAALPSIGLEWPVLFDGKRGLNVLFKLTAWSYKLLRHEAKLTLEALNNTSFDQFDAVFLQRVDEPCCRFDALARVPIPKDADLKSLIPSSLDAHDPTSAYAGKVYKVLSRGLGDRALLVHISQPPLEPCKIREHTHKRKTTELIIGLLLDPSRYRRILDQGPPPEQKKKASSFREFWGSKAELRRFPDGSILESVVWTDTASSKQPIFQQVIQYVATHHLSTAIGENISFVGTEFSLLLPRSHAQPAGSQTTTDFNPAMAAFDELSKDLQELAGLPLEIRRVAATGPALRYATVQVPYVPSSVLMEPADVVVQFESSGRWPDDLAAIQKTKLAFLLKMASLLEEAHPGSLVARVGLENPHSAIMNNGFLDVVYLTGASFRLRIYHDREATLLDRRLKDPSLPLRTRTETELARLEHRRLFEHLPRHAQDINKLAHRFPAFSPTVRLVKKWINAQLLAAHVPGEAVELLVARVFLYPAPFAVAASPMSGFLRVLTFLSLWDWRIDPVALDLSGEDLKPADFERIRDAFRAARKADPMFAHAAWVLASNHDRAGTLWTGGTGTGGGRPPKVVAARVTALATAAVELVAKSVREGGTVDVARLFVPSAKEYDFVIHVEKRFTRAAIAAGKKREPEVRFKNLQPEASGFGESDVAKLGLDPVGMFVEDLKAAYEDHIVLFWDVAAGGPFIGGVWSPSTAAPRKWKVHIGYSTVPEAADKDTQPMLRINKDAILNEISRLGGAIVTKIEVRR